MNSKTIAFIALMGALANILFALSNYLGPIIPGVSIDLSHIPTFIAALYGGPLIGFITGILAGIFPGIQYGLISPAIPSLITLIGLPIGKSFTGFTSGFLYKALRINIRNHKSILTIPLVLTSYIPEGIFTIFYFLMLLPYFVGGGGVNLLMFVLPKAIAEITFIGFFMATLVGNNGFNSFVANFFSRKVNLN